MGGPRVRPPCNVHILQSSQVQGQGNNGADADADDHADADANDDANDDDQDIK